MQNKDALVLTSIGEGLPNVVGEAFNFGLPVIASDVCENPRLIDEPRRGLLFRSDDEQSLLKQLEFFESMNEKQLDGIRSAAFNYAQTELSPSRMIGRYEELIGRCVAGD